MTIERDRDGLTAGQRAFAEAQVGTDMTCAGVVRSWRPIGEGRIEVVVDGAFEQMPPLSEDEVEAEEAQRVEAAEEAQRVEAERLAADAEDERIAFEAKREADLVALGNAINAAADRAVDRALAERDAAAAVQPE